MRLTSERLPWLPDEPPVPAPAAPTARPRPAGSMWPWYLLIVMLIAGVGAGAWWLITGKEAAAPVLPAEESFPIPVQSQQPANPEHPAAGDTAAGSPQVLQQPQLPALPTQLPPPAREIERPAASVPDRVRETTRSQRGIFPAEEPTEGAPPITGPTPIILYHPQPNRGRVVQLGAFPTRAQAEASWKRITRRYPYLATKPKMVNTVDVRGLGGGRPTRMHRLQLGTSSQAQSVVICQQLERAGHSCVVVY